MEIILQTIRIIDYESNEVHKRETPETFSEYVKRLIYFINDNKTIREYRTRSTNTEVISCILDVIKNQIDKEMVTSKIDLIAQRLLLKEREAQEKVTHMNIDVQKGSLIQALLYDNDTDSYSYLLAKVEHMDFVDDTDFSFKSGFSKDTKRIWKTCLFDIDDLLASEYMVKIYSSNVAKYWSENFLELDKKISDEINTEVTFRALDTTLNRNIKNLAPRDHMIIRNSLISYFKSNDYIDFDDMVKATIENYKPVELEDKNMKSLINKIKELPDSKKFDRQFSSVPSVINARIKKVYEVYNGIQLKITDAIDNFDEVITAYRDTDGSRYLRIKTNNDLTFRKFNNQK